MGKLSVGDFIYYHPKNRVIKLEVIMVYGDSYYVMAKSNDGFGYFMFKEEDIGVLVFDTAKQAKKAHKAAVEGKSNVSSGNSL